MYIGLHATTCSMRKMEHALADECVVTDKRIQLHAYYNNQ